jgi:hypothetical protein
VGCLFTESPSRAASAGYAYGRHSIEDGDIVADRQSDGLYRIRRWRAADGSLQAIDGHEELYDEEDMYRRLNRLRRTGETYVRDKPWMARLIQP